MSNVKIERCEAIARTSVSERLRKATELVQREMRIRKATQSKSLSDLSLDTDSSTTSAQNQFPEAKLENEDSSMRSFIQSPIIKGNQVSHNNTPSMNRSIKLPVPFRSPSSITIRNSYPGIIQPGRTSQIVRLVDNRHIRTKINS